MKTITLLALMIAAIPFFSCSKNNDSDEKLQDCRLLQNVRYENGTAIDSFSYQYNEQGQVNLVKGNNYNYALEYEDNKIVLRKYSQPASTRFFAIDTVQYYANGTINRIKRVDQHGKLIQITVFNYQNNKLINLSYYDKDSVLRARYDYTYTINNITSVSADELWNDVRRTFRYNLTYDTHANNFKLGQQALLLDGFLSDHMGLSALYVLSDNHVKTIEQSGLAIPVSYEIDNNNNVNAIVVGTQPVMRATYECR